MQALPTLLHSRSPISGCSRRPPCGRASRPVSDLAGERRRLVDEHLAGRGIRDGRGLEAMGRVPRDLFVTDRDRRKAYRDMPLRIGFGQTISQPYMVAVICAAAEISAGDRLLDI